ncbi:MAG: hypothetical protein AAFR16_13310, partial [Pseudomonadota bacterium]
MTDIAKGRGRDPETDSVAGVVRSSLWPLAPRLLAMSLFVNLLSFAAPMFVLQVYDRVIPHSGHQTLLALVIGVVALIGFDFVLRQARGRAIQMAALRVDVRLTRALFGRLTGAPLRALEQHARPRHLVPHRVGVAQHHPPVAVAAPLERAHRRAG